MMTVIRRNTKLIMLLIGSVHLLAALALGQYYEYQNPGIRNPPQIANHGPITGNPAQVHPLANLQYDRRDAERILWDQIAQAHDAAARPSARSRRDRRRDRELARYTQFQPDQTAQAYHRPDMYDEVAQGYQGYQGHQGYQGAPPDRGGYYDHRIQDGDQVQAVMAEARYISSVVSRRNGKSFLVIDKRNFQFYLYDPNGRLLRIGPVAVGKGKTRVGAFETPTGVFPIKQKKEMDDWIRPDWYFIEEGEPIPQRWEDRRVPGFFRYKMVVQGTRYIHYAEATGGRLTHGCLGLDWEDAEAVFHTLDVGSHCIVVDDALIARMGRGEWPLAKPDEPKKPEEVVAKPAPVAPMLPNRQPLTVGGGQRRASDSLRNLW
ncbi:MAG: L,D-transpeptidase [Thermodesulfobacteriota bacterium]